MRKRSLRGCLDCGFSDVGAAAAGFGPASYTEPIRTRRDAPLLAAGDLSKISLAPNWPPIHSAAAALPAWGDPWGGRCEPRGCSGGLHPTAGSCGKWGAHRTGGGEGGHGPGLGLQLHLVLAVQQLSSASRLRRRDEPRQASVTGLLIASGFVGCGS